MQTLQEIRGDATYVLVSQKLDMHMKNFDQDVNTQTRWIWELIQNAKDAKNKFGKVKIKQELNDQYFISSHNDDAFTLKELHSLVDQYSTKQQINSEDVKTTGKYGTGFITTFIISRVVTLEGIVKIQVKHVPQNESGQLEHQITPNELNQNFITAKDTIKHQQKPSQQQPLEKKKQLQSQQKNNEPENNKQQQIITHYKRFKAISLDRSFKNRDQQLPKKIKRTQTQLDTMVFEAQDQTINGQYKKANDYYENQRTVDSYDTCFKYKIMNSEKFKIVEKGVQNVRKLMAYAMVFNQNLSYYQFIDNRKKFGDISFSIERKQFKQIIINQNYYLFTYTIKSEYNHSQKQFKKSEDGQIICIVNSNKNPIAAIPLSVRQGKNCIERIDKTIPQIFKDFPLIGSSPIEWNAIINSNNFYPDEKRSCLMLNNIDEMSEEKVKTNQKHLLQCFGGIKDLYIFLVQTYCKKGRGLQNALIFSSKNKFAKENKQLQKTLENFIKQIVDTRFIPTNEFKQNNHMATLKEIKFISLDFNSMGYHEEMVLSKQIKKVFEFLFSPQQMIDQEYYEDFYKILNKGSQFRDQFIHGNRIQFISLINCLEKIQKFSYKQFYQIRNGNPFQKLHQIYSLLSKYNMKFVLDYKIYLNQKLQFKKMQDLIVKQIQPVFQELAKHLDIKIKHFFIHENFSKYFSGKPYSIKKFTIKQFNEMILKKFNALQIDLYRNLNNQGKSQDLIQLYQILRTLDLINNKSIERIQMFQSFNKIVNFRFNHSVQPLKQIKKSIGTQLKTIFVEQFKKYFELLLRIHSNLNNLASKCLKSEKNDQIINFLKDFLQDREFGSQLGSISLKLNCQKQFISSHEIFKLPPGIEYPTDQDYRIYDLLNPHGQNKVRSLKQLLIQPIYPQNALKQIKEATYLQLFEKVKANYVNLIPAQKKQIIQYIKSIYDKFNSGTCVSKTVSQKYHAWKNFIEKRLPMSFDVNEKMECFKDQKVKDFLFDLINDQNELKNSAQAYYKKSVRHLDDSQICDEVSNQPIKKLKTD